MLARLWGDKSGNVAVLAAFLLPALAVATGVGIDLTSLSRSRQEMQNVADAAALAGARVLATAEGDGEQRATLARETANSFILSRFPDAVPFIAADPQSAQVSVNLSISQKLAFGGVLGETNKVVTVEAEATFEGETGFGCVIALDASRPIGMRLQGAAGMRAPECTIWSNAEGDSSIYMQGSPAMSAKRVCAQGASGNRADRIEPQPVECGLSPDPYRDRVLSADPGCDFSNRVVRANPTPATLQPGTYCGGLSLEGGEIALEPGLYIVKDGPLLLGANSSVTGEGVSFLLTGRGAELDAQGSPSLTLSAMDSGPLAGIAIAVTHEGVEAPQSLLRGSPRFDVHGSIYLPGQVLLLQGTPDLTLSGESTKAVAAAFELRGNPEMTVLANDSEEMVAGADFLRIIH